MFGNSETSLASTVEIDEIFVDGKERNKLEPKKVKARRGKVGKTAVIGTKERGEKVATKPIPATDSKTLGGFFAETFEPGSSIHTDGASAYGSLGVYNHDAVNHSSRFT